MPTVALVVLPDDIKQDKTWNVKVRVSHKTKSKYINTSSFIVSGQLTKKFKIKDPAIIDLHNPTLARYRAAIGGMEDIDYIDCGKLKERLEGLDNQQGINFLSFIKTHIENKKRAGKNGSAATFVTVFNNLCDYVKSDHLDVADVTTKFLIGFEKYLRSSRVIQRPSNKGKIVEYEKQGVSDSGLHNQMRDLRLLFNACRNEYNDEDHGKIRIKNYPFKKYKVGQSPETEKRNLTIEQIKAIRDGEAEPGSRAELARDLFMLSFYLCGMNAADLYELGKGKVSRVNYYRKKTRSRRKDKAFISVKLIPEAEELYYKYAGKLQERYSSEAQLNAAINKGMPDGVDFYSARHSFGDLARNTCRFPVDDVGLAMNHKDRTNKTTDIYISKNWDILDEVQAAVVKLLLDDNNQES